MCDKHRRCDPLPKKKKKMPLFQCLLHNQQQMSSKDNIFNFLDLDGEAACEGHGFNAQQCQAVGCCQWEDGEVD